MHDIVGVPSNSTLSVAMRSASAFVAAELDRPQR
jgi:hypothetical protein